MDVNIGSVWFRVGVSIVMLAFCYAQTTPENVTTLDGTTGTSNMTIVANNTENTTSSKNFEGTTDFDYANLHWSSRNETNVALGDVELSTTEDIYGSNVSKRVPPGDGSRMGFQSVEITIAAVTAGAIILFFVLCYVGNMMNLCICRFFMYECPPGRYREAPKETT